MVWYSHLFQNFPPCIVIHTVKGFGIVNKAQIDGFFWNIYYFSYAVLCMFSLVLYAGQEATVRTGHGTTDWFQIGKGVRQG